MDNGDGGATANDNVLGAGEIDQTAYVCTAPSSGASWINVTSAAAVQTAVNTGYIANNTAAQVVFTLPAAAGFGDIVRIKGNAAPGWKLAQNAGQYVDLSGLTTWSQLSGSNWTQVHNTGLLWETSVASSSSGQVVAALPHWNNIVTVSKDGGTTWLPAVALADPNLCCVSMAPDASMMYIRSFVGANGFYRSSDQGATWTQRTTMTNVVGLAPYNGGLVGLGTVGGIVGVYVSTDGGDSWTQRPIAAAPAGACWRGVAASPDGNHIVAHGDGNGSCPAIPHFVSHDGGATWSDSGSAGPYSNRAWTTSISANGKSIVAGPGNAGHPIFVSSDGGATWSNTGVIPPSGAGTTAVSASGKRMVMAGFDSIFISNNAGATWASVAAPLQAGSIAGSSDLSSVYFGTNRGLNGGRVFKSVSTPSASPFTSTGAAGSITGGGSEALELQFLGGGAWGVLSGIGVDFVIQ